MPLPDPPFPALLVDLARRMTLPWREWITQLRQAVDGGQSTLEVLKSTLEGGGFAGQVEVVQVDLGPRGQRSGALELELVGSVDGPVMVQQGPGERPDQAQASQIVAVAEPRGGRRVRVHWIAVGDPARGRLVLHVLRGGG